MNNQELIQKWIEGSLTQEEKAELEKSDDYRSVTRIINASQAFKAPDFVVEDHLTQLQESKKTEPRIIKLNWFRAAARIAAAITIIVGAYFIFKPDTMVTFSTIAGNTLVHKLPDGSTLTLNSMSKITYDEDSWDDNRSLHLEGEAFFKVAKGSTFTVISDQGEVKVVGTQFNIADRTGYYEVVCYEGIVQVDHQGQTEKLTMNHSLRNILGVLEVEEYAVGTQPGWINRNTSFRKVPIGKVLEELERQYDIEIVVQDIDLEERFTGSFPHDDLELALSSVTTPLSLKFDKSNRTIEISRAD